VIQRRDAKAKKRDLRPRRDLRQRCSRYVSGPFLTSMQQKVGRSMEVCTQVRSVAKVVYKKVVGKGGGASHCLIGPYRAGEGR
jgi:hypothetical protein